MVRTRWKRKCSLFAGPENPYPETGNSKRGRNNTSVGAEKASPEGSKRKRLGAPPH